MLITEKNLVILYGSQSGNSQDLAERVWRKSKIANSNLNIRLSSFDSFNLPNLDENSILLCICSTTGQGDVPDNMLNFWKLIMRKSIPTNCFEYLQFAVVGLGDSSYDKYNFTAKKLYKRFMQLGGKPILDLCLCDEQQSDGIEGTFSKWINNFYNSIKVGNDSSIKLSKDEIYKYKIIYPGDDESKAESIESPQANELLPFKAKVIKNERVTQSDHWQDVRLIELDCNTNRINYEPGDVLMLRPSNLKSNVEKFLDVFQHLNLDLSKRIKIESNFKDEFEIGTETNENLIQTVGDLIEKYFDLNSIPRMSFFEILAELADDEMEKEKLEEFMTAEGIDDLYNYCYRPRRTIIEVFYDFPKTSKNIKSLECLMDLVPSIKPRSFSIASSPFVHQDKIQVLVAIVEYKTRLYETRKGTCSYWLSTLDPTKEDITIPVWIKKGSFAINWEIPIICVGPGTGVAPFRSIMLERIHKSKLTGNHLYFGCRSRTKDYYFEKEWSQIISEFGSEYLSVNPAFSRDQEQKIYVQDLLLNNSELVFNLIDKLSATILIAGSSKRMPQDVMAILKKIIKVNLEKTEDANQSESLAKDYIKRLELNKRIQMETWS